MTANQAYAAAAASGFAGAGLPPAEASVKVRTGPPDDGHRPDAALGLWAGELPLATTWQQPAPDPALPPGIPVPAHIHARAGTGPTGRPPACQLTCSWPRFEDPAMPTSPSASSREIRGC